MTPEKAQAIGEEIDYGEWDRGPNRVMRGLEIIARHVRDTSPDFEHEEIFAGDLRDSLTTLTEQEVRELALLGWRPDVGLDRWKSS